VDNDNEVSLTACHAFRRLCAHPDRPSRLSGVVGLRVRGCWGEVEL